MMNPFYCIHVLEAKLVFLLNLSILFDKRVHRYHIIICSYENYLTLIGLVEYFTTFTVKSFTSTSNPKSAYALTLNSLKFLSMVASFTIPLEFAQFSFQLNCFF